MKWFVLSTILFFSPLVFADDIPTEQPNVPYDYRCSGPLEYTSKVIQARLGGISEDTMIDDIMQAENAQRLERYTIKRVFEMMEIIHKVYRDELDFDKIEDVKSIYIEINNWCSGQLPPEKLEDRRWYDEDGDGFPDYGEDGEPIEKLEAEKSFPINT